MLEVLANFATNHPEAVQHAVDFGHAVAQFKAANPGMFLASTAAVATVTTFSVFMIFVVMPTVIVGVGIYAYRRNRMGDVESDLWEVDDLVSKNKEGDVDDDDDDDDDDDFDSEYFH